LSHVIDYTLEVRLTLRGVRSAELGDHSFEAVLLEPGSQGSEVRGCVGCTQEVAARIVYVEILMDIKCGIVDRVFEHVEPVRRRIASCRLGPGVTASVPISGCDDQIL